jgi:L-fucose/D-arabinose isomerase
MPNNLPDPDFASLASSARGFAPTGRRLPGAVPAIALTPVADGRTGAYEGNAEKTWRMVEKVHRLLTDKVKLPDGSPVRVVVAPEIVYGARTGALAQERYTREGVSANIWISRSWAYSDELMSAAQGLGSSEWQQAAWGLNQTDRPGAVWLKAFCAAMDEKERPIFSIYNPDLESEEGGLTSFVEERFLRFARCAAAAAEMRGKNYLSVGSVSMGIIGSDVRRNILLHTFGMGAASVDMVAIRGRLDHGFYDHEELEHAVKFLRQFDIRFGKGKRPLSDDDLLRECTAMTLIVRDLMIGNPRLADPAVAATQGFEPDVEFAQGYNAIAAGTQGQRAWTDLYPNFDLTEAMLNSSFDWTGWRPPFIVATENDCKNGIGMLAAHLITGLPQLFADIRTIWTPESVKAATGYDIAEQIPGGFIDKRNSGAGALDYALDVLSMVGGNDGITPQEAAEAIRTNPALQKKLIAAAVRNTSWQAAVLEYFRGDGLSSHYRTPGGIPMTAYRYNVTGDLITCSVIEGETVELPPEVADHVSARTDPTWPETYWTPWDMSAYDYMSIIGPNHDGNSFGLIGADLLTFNSMLRIPVDFHNIPEEQMFRPTIWDRYGDDDFRVCEKLGPVYR